MASFKQQSRVDRLACRVASGETIRDAAAALQIGERTGYRLSGTDGFRGRVATMRAAMVSAAAGGLASAMPEAVAVLRGLMTDAKDDVRLRAARSVVELGLKVVELSDLAERVAAIEARLKLEAR